MAPMTRCRAAEGDVATELMATYYRQRATAGLIITEGVPVTAKARGYLWTPGIYTSEQVNSWKQVTESVHAEGGRIFMQIWHVGRISHQSIQPDNGHPQGPTDELYGDTLCFAYDADGNPGNVATSKPEALDADAIDRVTQDFVKAAENAVAAGFDGVEIHGANGYLFDQFLNSVVNTRTDVYGGSVKNRCRFLLEVVDAVSCSIGMERTGVRISPNGRFNSMPEDPQMEETFVYLCQQLNNRKTAFLHVNDQRTFGNPAIPDALLPKIRKAFAGPIIVCGGYDSQRAKSVIDDGIADLVAFGASYIANPDLPSRLENQQPLNQPDPATFYGGGAEGYTDYQVYQGG